MYDTGKHAPGGRCSSREWSDGIPVDHAAQFVSVHTKQFADFIKALEQEGSVKPFGHDGRFGVLSCGGVFTPIDDGVARYIGIDGMGSLARAHARGLDVRQDVWVAPSRGIEWQQDGRWLVKESNKVYGCDRK